MPDTITFDHYEVLTRENGAPFELGRGAMGVTYKAIDTNLRMPVALKVITSKLGDSENAKQRFIREAQSAAKLRHRNVASVFHLKFTGETCFYAMEFIDGETVESLIRRTGPQPPLTALKLAVQVARALNAAAQHGLVHRDIKPANLMLVQEDEELCVKVIDFGLVKAQDAEAEDATVSMAGAFYGTALYASPEQMMAGEIDSRSDIYSLGATLWFMLAGEAPFSGSLAQVMTQQLTAQPPFQKLPGLPDPVEKLLRRMLAKEPAERPQTAAILRQDIEHCIESLAGGSLAAAARAAIEQENLAAAAAQAPAADIDPSRLKPGALAAGRYEIVKALGETNIGAQFRAVDQSRCDVRLIVVRKEWTRDAALVDRIKREVARLHELDHRNILRIQAFEPTTSGGLLLVQWTNGFSLLDLLRARRELPAGEAIAIVRQMGDGIDYAIRAGVFRVGLALHQIALDFQGVADPQPLLAAPVHTWPNAVLKLDPLDISGQQGDNVDATAARSVLVRGIARTAYELLGGSIPPLTALSAPFRFTKIAALADDANAVLKQGIEAPSDFSSATEFATEFDQALSGRPMTPAASTTQTRGNASVVLSSQKKSGSVPADAIAQPIPPAKTGSHAPLIIAAAALLALIAGGAWWWSARRQAPSGHGEASRAADVQPSGKDKPVEITSGSSSPAAPGPTAEEKRMAAFKAARENAQAIEDRGNDAEAITAWNRIAETYPEFDLGRTKLDILTTELRKYPENVRGPAFEKYREPITGAANLGVVGAMMLLAESEESTAPAAAFAWYTAAAKAGHGPAYTRQGAMLASGKGVAADLTKAADAFKAGAGKGDPEAEFSYSECLIYAKGRKADPREGFKMLKEASDGGFFKAMNRLGVTYQKGQMQQPVNLAEAVRLFSSAEEKGDPDACGNLGVLYMKGEGVTKDQAKGVGLFKKGADLGNAFCMDLLAKCFEAGDGVTQDASAAQRWYKAAAEKGYPGAIKWCAEHNVAIEGAPRP